LAPLVRTLVGKAGEDAWRHISVDTDQVEDLVIAKEGDHFATLLRGLRFQVHQEVQDPARADASVHVVTGLYQDGIAPDPTLLVVDQVRRLENFDQGLVSTMDVSHRDNPSLNGTLGPQRAGQQK
jgi:hypothetical protein